MEKPTLPPNPWKTHSSKLIYDNPWLTLHEDQVRLPSGGKGIYGTVSFKNRAVGIIPLDENNNTWLVGQYRYMLNAYSWEIPMGGSPLHAEVLDSAKRELKEETGFTAKKWEQILFVHTSNSITDEEGYVFVAEDLTPGDTEFDETEDLQIWQLPFKQALDMVLNAEITDCLSAAGIMRLARMRGL